MTSTTTDLRTVTDDPLRTVAGIPRSHAGEAVGLLQDRLVSLIDLELTLKHVHWNVTGPNFVAVHEMLDRFVAETRTMTDEVAERARTLGGVPRGTPGAVAESRSWEDYPVDAAPSEIHLRLLDDVYDHVVLNHRRAVAHMDNLDPVTHGLLLDQTARLEMSQWFVRSFLQGHQPDADTARFGTADRAPTPEEAAAAERYGRPAGEVRAAYEEMMRVGRQVKGEGAIT